MQNDAQVPAAKKKRVTRPRAPRNVAADIAPQPNQDTATLNAAQAHAIEKQEEPKVRLQKADLTYHDVKIVEPNIKNSRGEPVPVKHYFFATEGEEAVAPFFFTKANGKPTDREDLLEVFDKVFKPEDNFVLLKAVEKEVYSVLVPLKFASVNAQQEAWPGDYQLHAISFISDGSVNLQKFELELKKIAKILQYDNR